MRSPSFLLLALLNLTPLLAPHDSRAEEPPRVRLTEEVVVSAVRADEESAVVRTDLGLAEIRVKNDGRELPYVLREVPGASLMLAPKSEPMQHSASATPNPPSEQSWADATKPRVMA